MFCNNCGSQIPDGDRFCVECGAAAPAAPVAAVPTPAAPVEPTVVATPSDQYDYEPTMRYTPAPKPAAPAPKPQPAPAPKPEPAPEPIATPVPAPEPIPEPAPVVRPEPITAPAPKADIPVYRPAPRPEPAPTPVSTSGAGSATGYRPAPAVRPESMPGYRPTPPPKPAGSSFFSAAGEFSIPPSGPKPEAPVRPAERDFAPTPSHAPMPEPAYTESVPIHAPEPVFGASEPVHAPETSYSTPTAPTAPPTAYEAAPVVSAPVPEAAFAPSPSHAAYSADLPVRKEAPVPVAAPARTAAAKAKKPKSKGNGARIFLIVAICILTAALAFVGTMYLIHRNKNDDKPSTGASTHVSTGVGSYRVIPATYYDAVFEHDSETYLNLFPEAIIQEVLREKNLTRGDYEKALAEKMSDEMDGYNARFGNGWSYTVRIVSSDELSRRDLEDLKDAYADTYGIVVTDAMVLTSERIVNSEYGDETSQREFYVVQIGGNWYLDEITNDML